jgi:protein tyrosine phosphatase (PTP) superfamily phosphohydrolase (DUF442 family)
MQMPKYSNITDYKTKEGERMVCLPELADLSEAKIKKVKLLEKELGVVLIAFKPLAFADLTAKQVKDLQKMEKEIGATVIAYMSSQDSDK